MVLISAVMPFMSICCMDSMATKASHQPAAGHHHICQSPSRAFFGAGYLDGEKGGL